ncbi:hypothetical protein ACFOWX_07205 [Sphingorhabdus arenilitoris]|uniref:Uncharacterized protein n=1 Tax=Sphingorhabdus arenilitoris TaxID=1490041 RepID=A0ABV8RG40_9SPHN
MTTLAHFIKFFSTSLTITDSVLCHWSTVQFGIRLIDLRPSLVRGARNRKPMLAE